MKTKKTIQEIIDGAECPLDISVIPNHMGINLCSVEAIEWDTLEDGQLTNLNIIFIPKEDKDKNAGHPYQAVAEQMEKVNKENMAKANQIFNDNFNKILYGSSKKVTLAYYDDYNEVRDADTGDVVFSTELPDDIAEVLGSSTMNETVINNLINIWNRTGTAVANIFSGGNVDEYLQVEHLCSEDEREIITEALYAYTHKPLGLCY